MRRDGVEFRDALRILSQRAGVRLGPPDPAADEREARRRRLTSANEAAAAFYRAQLLQAPEAAPAREYLDQRGVSDAIADAFGIGHAPQASDALQAHLGARGFRPEELVGAGLAIEAEHGPLDRFRGRLIFPIRDPQGRCAGFGARTLSGAEPKYLNTPQTPLFDKSALLYGLDRARDAIQRGERAIIVEGYMDVVAAHQHGQPNVVASMGTALTERQAALLKPLSRHILLALDADAAGAAAAVRGVDTTREAVGTDPRTPDIESLATSREAAQLLDARDPAQLARRDARRLIRLQDDLAADIRIVVLPEGRDPDDLIRLDPELWSRLLEEAPPYLDHRFEQGATARDLDVARERAALVEELAPLVAAIAQPVVRAEYLQRLARLARVAPATIEAQIARARRGITARAPAPPPALRAGSGSAPPFPRDSHVEFLLRLVIARPEVVELIDEEALRWIPDTAAREMLALCLRPCAEEATWQDALPPELRELHDRVAAATPALPPYSAEQSRAAARTVLRRLRERHLRERLRLHTETIAEHERRHPHEEITAAVDTTPGPPERESALRSILESQALAQELHVPGGGKEDARP